MAEVGKVVLEKKLKMYKSNIQTDGQTDDRERAIRKLT
jgi:hypothetical protein